MKHIKIILAAVVIAAASLSVYSCKRGKDDPFLSFRSRDGRLAGTWKLVGIDNKSVTTDVSGSVTDVYTTTTTYSGGVETTSSSGGSFTKKYDFQFTIEKDGTYKSKTTNYNNSGTYVSTIEGDGSWHWGNDGKNKSDIIITDPKSSQINGEHQIDQLKNKKLVLRQTTRTKNAQTSSSSETATTEIYTFEAI